MIQKSETVLKIMNASEESIEFFVLVKSISLEAKKDNLPVS